MARANLLDEREDETQEPVDQLDTQDTTDEMEPQEAPEQAPEVDDDIPEKYRGKSLKDLVAMHQNAEQLLGKHSSEVGELRKVVDDFITTQLSQNKAPQQRNDESDDDVDFFVDPKTAVSKAIENHPKIREAEAYTLQAKKAAALNELKRAHPDMEKILQNPSFAEWIQASKVRTQLFVQADQQYDYDAANELFTLWKERAQVVQQTAQVEQQARKNAVKSASTGQARGATEPNRKKIYRRADIIKLMKTDPQRYQALSEEIFKAYQEGRVK